MLRLGASVLVTLSLCAQPSWDRSRFLSDVQSFNDLLPNLLANELLEQKSVVYPNRLHIRMGQDALKPLEPKLQTRIVASEIGYALQGKSSPVWAEVRKVVAVDGRPIGKPAQARARLLSGLKSEADRERARLLEEFAHYGLEATATDYTLSLLLFRPASIKNFQFLEPREKFIGADRVIEIPFRHSSADASLTVFSSRDVQHAPLSGILTVLAADSRPFRLQLDATSREGSVEVLDRAFIDYAPSRFGPVVPVSVHHTRFSGGRPFIESHYTYTNHQRFGADADIKFTAETDPK